MNNKLYVEYRIQIDPKVNQDTLHELAEAFQHFIHDAWNEDCPEVEFDTTDVTYEVVMEINRKG